MVNNRSVYFKNLERVLILVLFGLTGSFAGADDIEVFVPNSCNIEEKYRFIFVIDNSGSMTPGEFSQSKNTVDATISHVLDNLPQVQTAVVQYGSNELGTDHDYHVTVPFTNSKSTALNWQRAYGDVGSLHPDYFQDHQPASLAKMRNDNVYAPGGLLDITDGTNVQFIFFTDASRDISQQTCCSSIVADSDTFAPTNEVHPMFGEYNALKDGSVLPGGIKAQFTLLHRAPSPADASAGAAIASVGGTYNGTIEVNPDDPDGPGMGPRRYLEGTLSATDTSEILNLLDLVITEIHFPSETESFSEIALDTDRVNWATDNRAFIPLFKPSINRTWDGNIKGYFIGATGLEDTNGLTATEISDIGTVFTEQAQSFWSQQPDGNEVMAGGAASRLGQNRTLISNVSPNLVLTSAENSLNGQNPNVTNILLGVSSDVDRVSLLNGLPLKSMGDPLHTSPVLVNYAAKSVIYAMTNQGFFFTLLMPQHLQTQGIILAVTSFGHSCLKNC